jgi:alkanesulfonate monooxygenase SsuD/methylene tetrahydromethanopterin reductase-like flavin-dependent oxidoreductase (luciferase family)
VGTPAEIADRLEEWREAAIDGVNVFHAVRPDTFSDIADAFTDNSLADRISEPLTLPARV